MGRRRVGLGLGRGLRPGRRHRDGVTGAPPPCARHHLPKHHHHPAARFVVQLTHVYDYAAPCFARRDALFRAAARAVHDGVAAALDCVGAAAPTAQPGVHGAAMCECTDADAPRAA